MAMAVETLIPVEEYLRTSYSPDVEYVDGELVELNVGDPLHSLVQSNIIFALRSRYKNVKVLPEVRSKVTSTRYRLPDICVTLTFPDGKVLLDPPFVAIEILSEDDRMSRVIEKLLEFAAISTPHIWVIDPRLKKMFTFHGNTLQEVDGDVIATGDPRLELTRAEIFQE
jgi:Uma2 family endonuclease